MFPLSAFLAALPVLLEARQFTEDQLNLARRHIRQQIVHHTLAEGSVVDDFVEKMMEITMRDTDNHHKVEDWTEETETLNTEHGEVIKTTFLSPAFKLKTGSAHFTINGLYEVPLPKGDYSILNQVWELAVGADKKPVPLTEMYNHHWLIGGAAPLDLCEDDYFFGGGAEYRTMDYTFPQGYGQARIAATGKCGGNFHFINTEDLLLHWKGFNNPDGNHAAALKLCAECGYEPARADGLCNKWGDGSFLCCFTESRCRVNNPKNETKKEYRMKGTITYTRNFAGLKTGQVNLFDIGGNSRSERGQMLDEIAEWNVDSNLNNVGVHSHCNDTVCTMTESIVVSNGSLFGYGMCPGDMLWSYIHVHGGTLGGNVDVNGVRQCDILPKIGTDPNNAIGNEQGFLVGMGMCVDYRATGKKLRLNLGDVVTATAYYDVNPRSTKYLPLPGGKHGGIMALFFSVNECDEGTWNEVYVRRNNTCVGTPRSKSSRVGTFYQDKASCETQANPQESSTLEIAPPTSEEQTSLEEVEQSGKVDLVWRDCGKSSKWANITSLTPESMTIGGCTNLKAFGNLSRDVEEGNFTIKMSQTF